MLFDVSPHEKKAEDVSKNGEIRGSPNKIPNFFKKFYV